MTRLAAVALAALVAQNPQLRQADPLPAVVVGEVVDAATGKAVRQAIVRITGASATITRVADERGRFFFVNLPAGSYDITAMRDGYFDGAFGRVRAGGDALELPLAAGEWKTNITISLFRPAVISGAVDDEASEPLAGVRVVAFRRAWNDGREAWVAAGTTETDDRGLYRLHGLMPGEYAVAVPSVSVTMPTAVIDSAAGRGPLNVYSVFALTLIGSSAGQRSLSATAMFDGDSTRLIGDSPIPAGRDGPEAWTYSTAYYPAADGFGGAVAIVVGPGEPRTGINFRLRPVPAVRVSGRLEGPDGPVPGLLLRLLTEDVTDLGLGFESGVTVSRSDGSFNFLDIPAGRYVLSARSAAELVRQSPLTKRVGSPAQDLAVSLRGTEELWGEIPITVYDRDLEGLVVMTRRGAALSGELVFDTDGQIPTPASVSRLRVHLQPADSTVAAIPPVPTTALGRFDIAGIRPGRYVIRVENGLENWLIKSVRWMGRDIGRNPIDVAVGNEAENLAVTLTDRHARLTGSVYNNFGLAVPGARVVAVPAGRREGVDPDATAAEIRSTRANVYGVFELVGLLAGDYDLVAVAEEADIRWQDPGVLSRLVGPAVRVTVAEGGSAERSIRVSSPPRR